jgi:hypothetical protein
MIESNGISETVFKKHFVWLLDKFRSYLIAVGGCLMDYTEEKDGNLAWIMEINRISSNARGVKGVPPVFIHKQ